MAVSTPACLCRRIPLAAALAALFTPALAGAASQLKEVVVTATRSEAELDSVAASITSITREAMDRGLPMDESELFRDEPDIAFARDSRRFGATRPNIRGLEGKRVVQMVDGVRMPDFYNGGGPTNFTMNAPLGVPFDFMKRVEVLRGAASSLYGSDALGGVVGYLTLDAADLLGPDDRRALRVRAGAHGADEGLTGSLIGAGRGGALEWLIGYTEGRAREIDNQGSVDTVSATRTLPNPKDATDRGVLAKLALKPAAGHKLSLTLDGRDEDADVVIKRLSASLPKVTAMAGDDHARRRRASLEWRHTPRAGAYDRLTLRLHRQDSDSDNFNRQTRGNTGPTCSASSGAGSECYIEQDFFFEQQSLGAGLQLEKGWNAHLVSAGLDLSKVDTQELRDARVWRISGPAPSAASHIPLGGPGTVAPTRKLAGDEFPLRDFATGYTASVGLFVQDEIGLMDGRLGLTPALRYDWRRLKPEVDALSQQVLTKNGSQVVEQTDGAFSPKLAALWRLTPELALFGHLARGFRAPNYEEVNGHFRNTAQSYGVAPNPDLTPETSTGVELGLRLTRPGLKGQFTLYDNRYRDFIESVRLNCAADPGPDDPRCIADLGRTLMSLNLNKVRIWGAEARANWDIAPGWHLAGAIAYAHGDDQENHRPLNTIEPARASLRLARDAGTWGAEARGRVSWKVIRPEDNTWFRPPGHGVLDLSAWWRPTKASRLSVAVNNVFDEHYWLWSDIRQADANNPAGVDFYSQPGRSLNLAFEATF